MSIQSFGKELNDFSKRTGVDLDVSIVKVALSIFDGVTKKTPVATGRAKGNWNLSVGFMNTSVDETAKSTEPLGRPAKAPSLAMYRNLKPIYITNSLPYINRLEHGHSKQARSPDGMLTLTINEIRSSLL